MSACFIYKDGSLWVLNEAEVLGKITCHHVIEE